MVPAGALVHARAPKISPRDRLPFKKYTPAKTKRKGKIMDIEWKNTFISKAKKYKRDIIPTHIGGRNSNFFYNLSNIRKAIGIKANIEMLFLVNEFIKQRNSTLKITFGSPISYSTFDNRHTKAEWAEILRQYSYSLDTGYNELIGKELGV